MSTPTGIQSITLSSHATLADLQAVVTRVGERCPALAGRAARAGILLVGGAVKPIRPDVYEVAGSSGQRYAVDLLAETCSCPDFEHGAPEYKGLRWCKHLLAARILTKLQARKRPGARQARVAPFRRGGARRPVRTAA